MKYQELVELGRKMTAAQVEETLRQLGNDPRFAAVVTMLERNRDAFMMANSAQGIASDHGKLAHCAGSMHAVMVLQGQIKEVLEPSPKKKRLDRPVEE